MTVHVPLIGDDDSYYDDDGNKSTTGVRPITSGKIWNV